MIDLLPKPVSPDAVKPLLERGERLVSSFGPYHATSRRVILVSGPSDEAQTHELHYGELEGILEVCASDHKRMVLGTVMVVAGLLTMFVWFLIMPIVAIVVGAFVILQGSIGRPAYYQLKGRGMQGRELFKWQVKHYGAGSFIASINEITGLETAKD